MSGAGDNRSTFGPLPTKPATKTAAAIEADVGIFEYASPDVPGIGGTLKLQPADFVVSELRATGEEVTLDSAPSPEDDSVQTPGWTVAEEDASWAAADEAASWAAADDTATDEWVDRESDEEIDAEWADAGRLLTRFVLQKERMDTLSALGELAGLLGVPARNFSVAGLKDHRAVTCQEVVVRGVSPAAVEALLPPPGIRLGRAWLTAAPMRLGGCGGNRFSIVLRGVAGSGRAAKRVRRAMRALRRQGFVNYFGTQRFGAAGATNHDVGLRALLWRYEEGVRLVMTPPPGARLTGAEAEAYDAWAMGRDVRSAYRLMPRRAFLQKALLARLCGEDQGRGRSRAGAAHCGGGEDEGSARGGAQGHCAQQGGGAGQDAWSGCGDGRGRGRPNGWAALNEWSCRDAFLSLPLAQRRLFAHAYFSRLWNVAASERLRRYGLCPARQGELVLLSPSELPAGCECDGCVSHSEAHSYVRGRRRPRSVHVVTAEEEAAQAYGPRKLVLPLPGSHTLFPREAVGNLLRRLLSYDDVPLDGASLEVSSAPGASPLTLRGSYRHLILRPRKLRWSFVPAPPGREAAAPTEEGAARAGSPARTPPATAAEPPHLGLAAHEASDAERRKKRKRMTPSTDTAAPRPAAAAPPTTAAEASSPKSEPCHPSVSDTLGGTCDVLVEFDLPPGAYATMALREVSKHVPPPARLGHIRFSHG